MSFNHYLILYTWTVFCWLSFYHYLILYTWTVLEVYICNINQCLKSEVLLDNVLFNPCFLFNITYCFFYYSGRWVAMTCKHGVEYGLKFVLRAESVRVSDYGDLLFSLKKMTNIFWSDFAKRIARHCYLRSPEVIPLTPYGGASSRATEENIAMTRQYIGNKSSMAGGSNYRMRKGIHWQDQQNILVVSTKTF